MQLAQDSGLSSLHVLFPGEAEARCLTNLGALSRQTVQFHWFNRGYSTFDDYLDQLAQPKRKKVRAERRKVASEGVSVRRLVGTEITDADWSLFARCYRNTYAAHHSTPYLNPRFFSRLATTMPDKLLLVIASRGGDDIAAALALFDATRLYGRYWGALAPVPCLHFEAQLLPADRVRDRASAAGHRRRSAGRAQTGARFRTGEDLVVSLAAASRLCARPSSAISSAKAEASKRMSMN